ncbi:hypothetical protein F4820DRAFT_171039 [Hypoxylon rubiginosum]|uniref:Uncharacterized protein n=1 Tax=Hypoxylon rubiginosum TaxID=110542 RepID=A0ACB9Z9Y8_9PEZI|nr:hypothetical protein F4820DRAFT_171039 [Hypoxylon rubiginosum]
MSLQKINRDDNNEKEVLDLFLKHNEVVEAAEWTMLDMKLDEALLVLNAASWKPEDFNFFAGYLLCRTIRPGDPEILPVEHVLLAADVIQDCRLMDGTKIRTDAKIPSMLVVYAIYCVADAVCEGVHLQRYLRDEYKTPDLKAATDSAKDNADKTARAADKDRKETEAPSPRPSSSVPTQQPTVPAHPFGPFNPAAAAPGGRGPVPTASPWAYHQPSGYPRPSGFSGFPPGFPAHSAVPTPSAAPTPSGVSSGVGSPADPAGLRPSSSRGSPPRLSAPNAPARFGSSQPSARQ